MEFEEKIKQIHKQRKTILEDFWRAYLAENMEGETRIKNLVLNEQCIDGKYKWWFSVKDEKCIQDCINGMD